MKLNKGWMALAFVLTVGCTTKNNSMRSTGAPPQTNNGENVYDSGKGAPALGGPGDRSNASVGDARGSAHDSRADETHANALNKQPRQEKH